MCLFGTHVGKSSHIYVSILVVTTTCALNNPTDQAPWTAFAPVLLVNSSARTTLFSDKLELETIGCGLPEATVHRLLWGFEQVDLDVVYSQTCWHVFCVMFCFVLSCPSSLEEAMTWHKKGPVYNIYIYISYARPTEMERQKIYLWCCTRINCCFVVISWLWQMDRTYQVSDHMVSLLTTSDQELNSIVLANTFPWFDSMISRGFTYCIVCSCSVWNLCEHTCHHSPFARTVTNCSTRCLCWNRNWPLQNCNFHSQLHFKNDWRFDESFIKSMPINVGTFPKPPNQQGTPWKTNMTMENSSHFHLRYPPPRPPPPKK